MYAETAVAPQLRRWFSVAWTVRPVPGAAHRVLPDGHVDLVWLPGEAEPVVAGPATRPVLAAPAGGRVSGLRFAPGGAAALLGVAAHELRDRSVPLSWIDRGAPREPDRLVGTAAALLRAQPGRRIADVAREVGLSERQLRRRFTEWIGYGPKRYARVCRLQRMLALALAHGSRSAGNGAWLALESGYADQPHMAREVRDLAGLAPGALLAERGRFLQDGDAGT